MWEDQISHVLWPWYGGSRLDSTFLIDYGLSFRWPVSFFLSKLLQAIFWGPSWVSDVFTAESVFFGCDSGLDAANLLDGRFADYALEGRRFYSIGNVDCFGCISTISVISAHSGWKSEGLERTTRIGETDSFGALLRLLIGMSFHQICSWQVRRPTRQYLHRNKSRRSYCTRRGTQEWI